MKFLGLLAALAAGAGCAPRGAAAQSPSPSSGLNAAALAGQQVAVLPVTMVLLGPDVVGDSAALAAWRVRAASLLRADSMVGEALQGRAPEVQWVLPPQLRKLARRAPGIMPDPDHMGQAVLRSSGLKEVPDPLRTSMRKLVSLTESRSVLVPAALAFVSDTVQAAPVRASLTLALTDARRGSILWRTVAQGAGRTPDEALAAALAAVLPLETAP